MRYLLLFLMLIAAQSHAVNLQISWLVPTQRVDNSALGVNDLTGFEIRYRKGSEGLSALKQIVIADGKATKYILTVPDDVGYVIQIAAFDTTMLYSDYTQISYTKPIDLPAPKAPAGVKVQRQVIDIVGTCNANPTKCKVAAQGEWQ